MRKTILSLILLCSTLLAEVINMDVSPKFIEENEIKIIDIRTQTEWKERGVIARAYLITFFTENNSYHTKSFLKDLNMVVNKDEQFAIISNTATRTKLVSNFLGNKHNYNVINLIGGMSKLLEEGYKVKVYESHKQSITLERQSIDKEETNTTVG